MFHTDKAYLSNLTTALAVSAIGHIILTMVFRNPQSLVVEDLSSLKG